MSDDDALLAAIAANPGEDTPRLMYADWLEEHGRPRRAEFIRVQIDLARLEHLPRAALDRHVDLFRRNQELIDGHRAELLGAAFPAEAGVEFRRGFAWEVTLSVFHFHQLRDALGAMRPLPRVAVRDSVGLVRSFLGFNVFLNDDERAMPFVTGVATVPGDDAGDGWDRFEAFSTPLAWPRLETLDVSGCRLGDRNAPALFWGTFPALTDLDVSGNDLTDRAVDSLLDSDLPRRLKRLILGGNDITDAGAVALAERWPTGADDRLETLNLRFAPVGQPGQSALLNRFGGRVDLF